MKILKAFVISFLVIVFSVNAVTKEELIEYANQQNDSKLIEILIKYGNVPGSPYLNVAMDAQDYFAVWLLIENGVDINSRLANSHQTVLERAILLGETALVEYFLSKNADPTRIRQNIENRTDHYMTTAVHDVIKYNRLDILILFYQYGVDLNEFCFYRNSIESTPLKIATEYKRNDIVAFLLSIGVNLN